MLVDRCLEDSPCLYIQNMDCHQIKHKTHPEESRTVWVNIATWYITTLRQPQKGPKPTLLDDNLEHHYSSVGKASVYAISMFHASP